MSILGNIIWLIFGGFIAGIGYIIGGLVLCVTIVGIPFGVQAFKMSNYVLWPFGRTVVMREDAHTFWTLVGNVIWILIGGWWLLKEEMTSRGIIGCVLMLIGMLISGSQRHNRPLPQ